ncbi:hypothetical protein DFAR_3650001 [Desulfarculales bacterium]
MVCNMSPAFLTAINECFPSANVTVDWFHSERPSRYGPLSGASPTSPAMP